MTDKARQQPLRLQGAWAHLTLDAIAETASRARPSRRAFTDSPDRETFTDGAPRELPAGQLGREMQIFARKLATLGVKPGDRVIVMMPNVTEGASALLGLMLAGLVPCALNVVSSSDDIQRAAERVKAVGVVTVSRYAHLKPAQAACEAASRYYGIRFVGSFGGSLPSGVIPLSDWPDDDISTDTIAAPQPHHAALISFDTATGEPHVRTHAQIISEALALSAISGLTSRGNLLGTFTPVTAAGMIASIAAPLISGAHVHLHGPFSPDVLTRQLAGSPDAILILPSAAEHAVRSLAGAQLRDTIVINREPGGLRPASSSGRVTELVSLGEWATWSLFREPERRRLRLPRGYGHPVATAFPRGQVLIQSEISSQGRLTISGPALAIPDIDGVVPTAYESSWSAQGDGAQHISVVAGALEGAEGEGAATIAA
ncbi:MAG: AMP-binding protein [Beijerinckiaceae bacterium]